jgi:16S rRNA (cytidine1402-2'-O)-methyltransferase
VRGRLYLVVARHPADLTQRARETLRSVDAIACDDDARPLVEPSTPVHPIDVSLCERMDAGESVALISSPLSPAGTMLVKEAIRRGFPVIPIAEVSRELAALRASGLPAERVLFLGALPRADGERRELLAPLRAAPYTLVIEESGRRLADTLRTLERILGDRRAVVAREDETIHRDRIASLAGAFLDPPRGDVLILIGPVEARTDERSDLISSVRALLAGGLRPTEVAKAIGGRFGLAKKEAYRAVMDVHEEPRTLGSPAAQPLEDLLLERLRAYAESLQGHAPENMYGLIMPQLERPLIRVAMELAGGRQIQAAEMLGIHRNTLRMKLRSLGLDEDRPEPLEET